MTNDEHVAKLHDIEWEDFEVKTAKSELPKNVWESVSAFSNTSGGWIVLEVKQSGKTFEIQGVDNIEKLEQDFLGTLRSEKFNQRLSVTSKQYDINSKKLLAFYVPEVDMKPVYFGNPINTFIRMGSGDQRATEGEIRAMFRDQSFGKKSEGDKAFDELLYTGLTRTRSNLVVINLENQEYHERMKKLIETYK